MKLLLRSSVTYVSLLCRLSCCSWWSLRWRPTWALKASSWTDFPGIWIKCTTSRARCSNIASVLLSNNIINQTFCLSLSKLRKWVNRRFSYADLHNRFHVCAVNKLRSVNRNCFLQRYPNLRLYLDVPPAKRRTYRSRASPYIRR